MAARRNRGGEPDVSAEGPDEAEHEWCIICPGATECYFGVSGEAFPTFSVSEPWCSLECIPDVLYATNAPQKMKKFAEYLRSKSRRLVITVPATCDDSTRLRLCSSVFERTGVVAVALLSEAVACSYACGKTEGVTVLDLGWSHATASFVEFGRTSKFVSSRTLALGNFFLKRAERRKAEEERDIKKKMQMVPSGTELSSSPGNTGTTAIATTTTTMMMKIEGSGSEHEFNINRGAILDFYTQSSTHLAAMCAKMPLRALQDCPLLLAGGGGGCEGLGSKLSSILKGVVSRKIQEEQQQQSSSSSSSSMSSGEYDDDDDVKKEKKDSNKKNIGAGEGNNGNSASKGRTVSATAADGADDGGEVRRNNSDDDDDDDNDDPFRVAPAMAAIDRNVTISTIIRVRADAARLFVFRGASLVASTGVFEEVGAVSLDDWCTTIENAGGASLLGTASKRGGDGIAANAGNEAVSLRSWGMMSEAERDALGELVAWRFPM